MKLGQSSAEFIILLSVTFLMLAIMTASVGSRQGEVIEVKGSEESLSLAQDLANEINYANSTSMYYQKEFNLPDEILGEEYNLTFTDGNVVVQWSSREGFNALENAQYQNDDVVFREDDEKSFKIISDGEKGVRIED